MVTSSIQQQNSIKNWHCRINMSQAASMRLPIVSAAPTLVGAALSTSHILYRRGSGGEAVVAAQRPGWCPCVCILSRAMDILLLYQVFGRCGWNSRETDLRTSLRSLRSRFFAKVISDEDMSRNVCGNFETIILVSPLCWDSRYWDFAYSGIPSIVGFSFIMGFPL